MNRTLPSWWLQTEINTTIHLVFCSKISYYGILIHILLGLCNTKYSYFIFPPISLSHLFKYLFFHSSHNWYLSWSVLSLCLYHMVSSTLKGLTSSISSIDFSFWAHTGTSNCPLSSWISCCQFKLHLQNQVKNIHSFPQHTKYLISNLNISIPKSIPTFDVTILSFSKSLTVRFTLEFFLPHTFHFNQQF